MCTSVVLRLIWAQLELYDRGEFEFTAAERTKLRESLDDEVVTVLLKIWSLSK